MSCQFRRDCLLLQDLSYLYVVHLPGPAHWRLVQDICAVLSYYQSIGPCVLKPKV
jgi:hypothetical protein